VIFMVTAPLMNPGTIDLPSIGKASAPPAAPIEISIRASGALSMTDRDVSGAERPVNREELIRRIKEKQKRKPDQPVVISADKDVKYEKVIEVMDLLQQNQVKKVGLLAKPRSG
jgi:biopolymer transport protein TolR